MDSSTFEQKVFLALLVVVSLAFAWVLAPFYGAVFWAVILAIIFAPVQRRMCDLFKKSRNLSALLTLLMCLVVAVMPVIFMTGLLVQEGALFYKKVEAGEIDIGGYVTSFKDLLPAWLQIHFQRFGLEDMDQLRERFASAALAASQFLATKAFSFGQGTFQFVLSFFVMLYLLFYFIRDGRELVGQVKRAVPLGDAQKRRLFSNFTRVARATVKGNVVVAVIQGALGGIIFAVLDIPGALLWGALMAFLSLLPAIGAGLVWAPVVVYFLMSGAIVPGVILALYGVLVIGLVDNILRPILVGKDIRMPDYLVLLSTLGGLALFGLSGFVIGPLIAALFISAWGLFVSTD